MKSIEEIIYYHEQGFEQYLETENSDKTRKSSIVETLLHKPINEISQSIFYQLKPKLNITSKEILNTKSIKKISYEFCLFFRQFQILTNEECEFIEDINNFNYYGLTISDFKPSECSCPTNRLYEVALSKMTTPKLVKSKLVRIYKQQLELQQIKAGKVDNCMSDLVYGMMLDDKKAVDEYLSNRFIEFGEERRTLLELKENAKTNRMNELCVIKNHINTLVNDEDWGCRFITITNKPEELPRAYNRNDKTHWNGISTPSDNVKQLQDRWRNIQSYAKRKSIPLIGIWCREPHKKSGVHQHLLIFTKRDFLENDKLIYSMTKNQTKNLLGKYRSVKKEILDSDNITLEKMFLNKFGYTNRSCKIDVLTNQGKSQNIVNYITKYIMKTIDLKEYNGTSIENDDETHINKISFHRSLWQYRAYGFFGFKKELGLWRMFQKIKNIDSCCSSIAEGSNIEKALNAAKEGDFSKFLEVSPNIDIANNRGETTHGEYAYTPVGLVELVDGQAITGYCFDKVEELLSSTYGEMLISSRDIRPMIVPKYEVKTE
ncbi:replication endonuclease [Vibrio sp. LaRot3]|uniref:replication endonuclease n=1 Tax=Vibrio sp. LaRot3 TaxID=2998829 RepID=UPI0022CDDFF4|nr:replication endonuclease [Vibrio sp. LaRot3]MDA0150633.1 replication endonuclease [Vibrio sp. LaRot3]